VVEVGHVALEGMSNIQDGRLRHGGRVDMTRHGTTQLPSK
jgi:hypothetical protein